MKDEVELLALIQSLSYEIEAYCIKVVDRSPGVALAQDGVNRSLL